MPTQGCLGELPVLQAWGQCQQGRKLSGSSVPSFQKLLVMEDPLMCVPPSIRTSWKTYKDWFLKLSPSQDGEGKAGLRGDRAPEWLGEG